jgi:hypothetical protein
MVKIPRVGDIVWFGSGVGGTPGVSVVGVGGQRIAVPPQAQPLPAIVVRVNPPEDPQSEPTLHLTVFSPGPENYPAVPHTCPLQPDGWCWPDEDSSASS